MTLTRSASAANILLGILSLPLGLLFGIFCLPLTLPFAVWLVVLGLRIWPGIGKFQRHLLVTHVVVLVMSLGMLAYGIYAVGAAERSTQAGGGLLAPLAMLPMMYGIAYLLVGALSLFAVRFVQPTE